MLEFAPNGLKTKKMRKSAIKSTTCNNVCIRLRK